MRRRELITVLGGAMAWPLAAHAQQRPFPVIGFMSARSPEDSVEALAQFHKGLGEDGFVEGRNVTIKYRWARGEYGRLAGYVDELIGQKIDLLAALGGDASARAAQKAASSVPVVFAMGGDPIHAGLVKSFNTPGGNMTGVVIFSSDAETKRLSLLHELAPTGLLGALVNPEFPPSAGQVRDLRAAAPKLGRQLIIATASDDAGLDAALASLLHQHVVAAQIASDPYFDSRRERIIAFAAQNRLPVVYQFREYVIDGGLLSYGPTLPDACRQVGVYAARILKGARAADLPIWQANKFDLVLNLKTAKALGLEISPSLLLRADEVIE
jgi:putative ABC transport system substrate-binding protein